MAFFYTIELETIRNKGRVAQLITYKMFFQNDQLHIKPKICQSTIKLLIIAFTETKGNALACFESNIFLSAKQHLSFTADFVVPYSHHQSSVFFGILQVACVDNEVRSGRAARRPCAQIRLTSTVKGFLESLSLFRPCFKQSY